MAAVSLLLEDDGEVLGRTIFQDRQAGDGAIHLLANMERRGDLATLARLAQSDVGAVCPVLLAGIGSSTNFDRVAERGSYRILARFSESTITCAND